MHYNIFCCSTVYHVLISSLIAYKCRSQFNILVVNITSFKCGKDIKKNNRRLFNRVYTIVDSDISFANKSEYLNYKKHVTKKMEHVLPEIGQIRKCKSDCTCYICEDGHDFSRYFVFNFKNLIMLEEGMQIYKAHVRNESLIKRIIKYKVLGINKPNGYASTIKELWVQYPENLPAKIAYKGKKLDLLGLLQSIEKTEYENELLSILGIPKVLWDSLITVFSSSDKKIVLLVTQPFSEDGLIKEETKIEIYKSIADRYDDTYRMIIKPHPREETDYSKIFPEAVVIDNSFPLELLKFVIRDQDIRIEEAVTVDSTAVMNIRNMCNHVCVLGRCEETKELGIRYPLMNGYRE